MGRNMPLHLRRTDGDDRGRIGMIFSLESFRLIFILLIVDCSNESVG
jgi:hypothetical protein